MQIRKKLSVLLLLVTLGACGQSGPLYLPEDAPEKPENTPEESLLSIENKGR